jgi:hypothetical protein
MTETSLRRSARWRSPSPAHSRGSLRWSVARRFVAASWILAAPALLAACAADPQVISADRTIAPLPNGHFDVTGAWLTERYMLERSLRLQLDRCESGVAAPGGHP